MESPSPTGLAEIELLNIDRETKAPPVSRLKDAGSARAIYAGMARADEGRSTNRARVQSMIDGEAPFNQQAMIASGQGEMTNVNFLEGEKHISSLCNGYNDIVTSSRCLCQVRTDWGELGERANIERVIDEEATRTIRKWSGWTPTYWRVIKKMVTHGVGVGYFPDTRNFRPKVCGLDEFKIPDQTPASEEEIEIAIAPCDMLVTDLYRHVEKEEVAENLGWNRNATLEAVLRATKGSTSRASIHEVEKFQQEIKNNDLFMGQKFGHIPVLHIWVREFDGTISFFICERDGSGEMLCSQISKYKNADEAFVLFSLGVGANGTYHSIRGAGHAIFPIVQMMNRFRCRSADSAALSISPVVQVQGQKAWDELAVQRIGPLTVVSQGVDFVERAFPDLSKNAMPMLSEFKQMLGSQLGGFQSDTKEGQGVYQSRLATEAALNEAAQMDHGSSEIFFASLDRLIREMVRRITLPGGTSDPLVKEFRQRCAKRGVTAEMLKSIDHASTVAYRPPGSGSAANRTAQMNAVLQVLPNLPDDGQQNAIYDWVANRLGFQQADRYASPADQPRANIDEKIAELQNHELDRGTQVMVYSSDLHATHAKVHMPALNRIIDGVENGQIDPFEALPAIQAHLDHLAQHGEALAQDPTQRILYGAIKETVNNSQQILTNMERKIRAEQRKAAELEEQGGTEQGGANETDYKMALADIQLQKEQLKLQIIKVKAEMDASARQAKYQQELALNDAKGAMQAQAAMAYPATSYGQRG